MDTFSARLGYKPTISEIKFREEAPDSLRGYLPLLMAELMGLKAIRKIVCKAVKQAPDPNNWGENEFMKSEIEQLIYNAEWFQVYDIIEIFANELSSSSYKTYEEEINDFFLIHGIGWQLKNKKLEIRGEIDFEETLKEANNILESSNVPTSSKEIQEAIKDLSRRPNPEITGAVQHSVAALECLSRKITGDSTMTLGQLIKKNPNIVPEPLNGAVSKIFGFASIKGRHLEEGKNPTYEEAELLVHLSAAICTYLCKVNSLNSQLSPFD